MTRQYTEPISWLTQFDEVERQNIISWFNEHMDVLVAKQGLLQFNNPNNSLIDIVDCLKDMALIAVAPDLDSTEKDFSRYVTIMQYKEDIGNLTYQYCKNKFNQAIV